MQLFVLIYNPKNNLNKKKTTGRRTKEKEKRKNKRMKKPYFSKIFQNYSIYKEGRKKDFGAVQGRNGDKIENAQENIYPDNHGRKIKEPERSPLRISPAPFTAAIPISVFAELSIGRNKATKPKTPAIKKLDNGPEIATKPGPHFDF